MMPSGNPLSQPRPRNLSNVLMLHISQRVQSPHLGIGDLISQLRERGAHRGILLERRRSHDGSGLVGWEVATIVNKNRQIESRDLSAGRVAGDYVHATVSQRAVRETEIHGAGRPKESHVAH